MSAQLRCTPVQGSATVAGTGGNGNTRTQPKVPTPVAILDYDVRGSSGLGRPMLLLTNHLLSMQNSQANGESASKLVQMQQTGARQVGSLFGQVTKQPESWGAMAREAFNHMSDPLLIPRQKTKETNVRGSAEGINANFSKVENKSGSIDTDTEKLYQNLLNGVHHLAGESTDELALDQSLSEKHKMQTDGLLQNYVESMIQEMMTKAPAAISSPGSTANSLSPKMRSALNELSQHMNVSWAVHPTVGALMDASEALSLSNLHSLHGDPALVGKSFKERAKSALRSAKEKTRRAAKATRRAAGSAKRKTQRSISGVRRYQQKRSGTLKAIRVRGTDRSWDGEQSFKMKDGNSYSFGSVLVPYNLDAASRSKLILGRGYSGATPEQTQSVLQRGGYDATVSVSVRRTVGDLLVLSLDGNSLYYNQNRPSQADEDFTAAVISEPVDSSPSIAKPLLYMDQPKRVKQGGKEVIKHSPMGVMYEWLFRNVVNYANTFSANANDPRAAPLLSFRDEFTVNITMKGGKELLFTARLKPGTGRGDFVSAVAASGTRSRLREERIAEYELRESSGGNGKAFARIQIKAIPASGSGTKGAYRTSGEEDLYADSRSSYPIKPTQPPPRVPSSPSDSVAPMRHYDYEDERDKAMSSSERDYVPYDDGVEETEGEWDDGDDAYWEDDGTAVDDGEVYDDYAEYETAEDDPLPPPLPERDDEPFESSPPPKPTNPPPVRDAPLRPAPPPPPPPPSMSRPSTKLSIPERSAKSKAALGRSENKQELFDKIKSKRDSISGLDDAEKYDEWEDTAVVADRITEGTRLFTTKTHQLALHHNGLEGADEQLLVNTAIGGKWREWRTAKKYNREKRKKGDDLPLVGKNKKKTRRRLQRHHAILVYQSHPVAKDHPSVRLTKLPRLSGSEIHGKTFRSDDIYGKLVATINTPHHWIKVRFPSPPSVYYPEKGEYEVAAIAKHEDGDSTEFVPLSVWNTRFADTNLIGATVFKSNKKDSKQFNYVLTRVRIFIPGRQ